jgi:hypothetical protein
VAGKPGRFSVEGTTSRGLVARTGFEPVISALRGLFSPFRPPPLNPSPGRSSVEKSLRAEAHPLTSATARFHRQLAQIWHKSYRASHSTLNTHCGLTRKFFKPVTNAPSESANLRATTGRFRMLGRHTCEVFPAKTASTTTKSIQNRKSPTEFLYPTLICDKRQMERRSAAPSKPRPWHWGHTGWERVPIVAAFLSRPIASHASH